MSPGGVLCLDTGSYGSITNSSAYVVTQSGTAGSPIIVTSAPGQTATIQGALYINASNVTFEYLNLNEADVLYSGNGGSNPVPCPYPLSEGMQINGSNVTLQDNNIYESNYRGVLIGINYGGSPTSENTGVVITHNNIGPGGGCSDSQHLIYADYTSGMTVTQNWFFDDPYGFGVQFYVDPANSTVSSNVFDNVLDATIEDSGNGGNVTSHNVSINSAVVANWNNFTGKFVDCFAGAGDSLTSNAIFNDPNGFGAACSGVTISGSQALTANPFVGGMNSDTYALTPAGGTALAGYGLWDGTGPPSPNPALSYPPDPTNTDLVGGVAVPTG